MIGMGDELWRTQRGNNNPYCHDSELTWVDWRLDDEGRAMLDVARALTAFRKRHVVFRRHEFMRGERIAGSAHKDILWLRPDGAEMTASDWAEPEEAALAFLLDGTAFAGAHDDSEAPRDASFVVFLNGERDVTAFILPSSAADQVWRIVVDTRERPRVGEAARGGQRLDLDAGALLVLTDAGESTITAPRVVPDP
jgi:glycogen operon protein